MPQCPLYPALQVDYPHRTPCKKALSTFYNTNSIVWALWLPINGLCQLLANALHLITIQKLSGTWVSIWPSSTWKSKRHTSPHGFSTNWFSCIGSRPKLYSHSKCGFLCLSQVIQPHAKWCPSVVIGTTPNAHVVALTQKLNNPHMWLLFQSDLLSFEQRLEAANSMPDILYHLFQSLCMQQELLFLPLLLALCMVLSKPKLRLAGLIYCFTSYPLHGWPINSNP